MKLSNFSNKFSTLVDSNDNLIDLIVEGTSLGKHQGYFIELKRSLRIGSVIEQNSQEIKSTMSFSVEGNGRLVQFIFYFGESQNVIFMKRGNKVNFNTDQALNFYTQCINDESGKVVKL